MMKRLYKAVKEQNMFKSKHIAGEYFVALNRRFVLLLIHADRMGLFRGVGKNRSEDAMHLHRIKRELEDQVNKAQKAINFILENFNDLRISDGLLDEPFVKLGVQTVKVFTKAFKQAIKVGRANVLYYTDMITDIVRLALVEKKHEAAIQRAGAGVLSGMRRDSKTVLEIQRWYARQKCFGPEEDEAELKESSKIEEKPNDA
ncbi:uncharacterized protein LOC116300439 [Actinia tenebrosa]|uniref:Uncharacterized protein LOC116300439 n=1 Tax=Actinia tenebrosa TaxID=6105 RepID=A0A6P8I9C4_ACTTE|nr:uncharacterized protein LOC116300439 [Actinia tenebrosa]